MNRHTSFSLLFLGALLAGCNEGATDRKKADPVPAKAKKAPPVAPGKPADASPQDVPAKNPLLDPGSAEMKKQAPAEFTVKFETTAGAFSAKCVRSWSPNGVDRFYNLVRHGFYDGCRFFRVVPGFVVQFGLNGKPNVNQAWDQANIQDDPVKQGNKRGRLTFAKTNLPHTRSTQVFISFKDNSRLDPMGFAAIGEVTEGMASVDAINAEYGQAPDQGRIQREGNEYLKRSFPKLDYIKTARITEPK